MKSKEEKDMAKVLLLNGSPRPNGCTATALKEMIPVFEAEGIETEIIHVGNKDIRGCISCGSCAKTGKCIFNDLVNEVAPKFELLTYEDAESGISLQYQLFVPENYDPSVKYPLLQFIPDSSVVGKDAETVLTQGWG